MPEKINLFLSYMLENKGKSPQKIKNYRRLLGRFHVYLLKIEKSPDEVDAMEIEAYTGPILSKEGMGGCKQKYRDICDSYVLPVLLSKRAFKA